MIMGAALTQRMIIVPSQPVEQLCNKGHIKTKRGAWLAVHLDQTGLEIQSPQGPAQQGERTSAALKVHLRHRGGQFVCKWKSEITL